ncbi:MAG: hypothetical protein EZS28_028572 [Streblomastix strix]|uniref:Protein kinase domain-containing protein n=1 Tax=Streblomastix strix TaxID=222440 RepID=A0A5J4V1I6_9EUKA|nr:MAG: hypothetical protein EZS28_028572 [Streblomastix strix]
MWNLLTKMLSFGSKDRFTATETLNHEFFTDVQASRDISPEIKRLGQSALQAQQRGDKSITPYDTNESFDSQIKRYIRQRYEERCNNFFKNASYDLSEWTRDASIEALSLLAQNQDILYKGNICHIYPDFRKLLKRLIGTIAQCRADTARTPNYSDVSQVLFLRSVCRQCLGGLRDNIDAVLSEAEGTTMTASLFLELLDKVIVPYVTNA